MKTPDVTERFQAGDEQHRLSPWLSVGIGFLGGVIFALAIFLGVI